MSNFAKQTMTFVDEKSGVEITFDVQSTIQQTGDAFNGYMPALVNLGPTFNRETDRDGKKYESDRKKIERAADQYFAEHPEKLEKMNPFLRAHGGTYDEYLRIVATDLIRERQEKGESTPLENAYLDLIDNKLGKKEPQMLYCWDQIIGTMPLDASKEDVIAGLKRDNIHQELRLENEEYLKSVERGRVSLGNKVAESQNLRIDIKLNKRGDGHQTATLTQGEENSDKNTLTPDEAAYVVNRYIQKKINGQ